MSTFVQIRADGGTPISIAQQTSTEVANTPELITTTGAGSWTKPDGVTKVLVECWGGGGAGGGASTNNSTGGGGAGGQYARKLITYSSAGQSISYSVAASVAGTTGAGSSGDDTTWDTNVVVAKGGQGGQPNGVVGSTSAGGVGSTTGGVGDTVYAGGDGTFGYTGNAGPGGGGAGSTGPGQISINGLIGGSGATENGGAGGGGTITSNDGKAGDNYGGGGGGANKTTGASRIGGSGAQGLIRITTYSGATQTPPGVSVTGKQ